MAHARTGDGKSKADGRLHRLELAAAYVATVGRPRRDGVDPLPSSVVADCCVALATGDMLKVAADLCRAPEFGAGAAAAGVDVDVVAASALVRAAADLGHRKSAKRLRKTLLGDDPTRTGPLAVDIDAGGRLAASEHATLLGVPWSPASPEGFLTLPPAVSVVLVDDAPKATAAVDALRSHAVVGVDVEWPPGDDSSASLLQVACVDAVFVVDLPAVAAVAQPLFAHLATKTLLFFGAGADVDKLRAGPRDLQGGASTVTSQPGSRLGHRSHGACLKRPTHPLSSRETVEER